ncbi:MAG TPA: T9SS type A sorting domain-containing protein, partial [Saprospiraceae bacterium]|nr:T9SS type A sorting domain-containing protein [Saprospiraceae bacterium]
LSDGAFTHSSGLTMADGSKISRSGGTTFTGTAPTAAGKYDVSYTGALTTSVELPTTASAALNNLTIAGNVNLDKAITIFGDATFNSGTFNAGSFDVTMSGSNFTLTGGTFSIGSSNTITFNKNGTTIIGGSGLTTGVQFGNLTIGSTTNLTVSSLITSPLINVSATWTNSGVFTPNTSTVAFNGGGTQNLDPNGQPFYNVTFGGSGQKTLLGSLVVNGVLSITSTLSCGSNFPISVAGSWSNSGSFIANSGTVTFNGAAQTISQSPAQPFFNLTLSGSGIKLLGNAINIDGVLTIGNSITFDVSTSSYAVSLAGNWNNSGTFTPRNGIVTFDGNTSITGNATFNGVTITGALIAPSGNMDVAADWLQNGGSFAASGGTLRFNGGTQSITPGGQIFNHVIISGSNNKTLQGPADINGDLTISGGTFNVGSNQQVNLAGNFNATGGALNAQNGLFVFDGGAQSITSAGQSFYWVRMTGAGSRALQDAFSANNNLEIFSSAALTAGSNTITVGGYWDATGGSFSSTGTTFLTSNTGQTIKSNGSSFGNLTINGGGTKTLQDALDVNGNLTLTSPLNVGGSNFAVNVGGDWNSSSGAFAPTGGTVTLDGAAQNITLAAGGNFFNLTIAGSGTKTQQSDVDINGNLLISSSALSAGSDKGLAVAGNWTNNVATGGYIPANGSVTFDGGGTSDVAGTGTTDFFSINVATPTNLEIENNVNLYGTLTLILASHFDADGSGNAGVFTVKSTSQTAGGLIAALPNPTFFTGNVTVERYIHSQSGGDWRYISIPITNGNVGALGSSILVTGNFSDASSGTNIFDNTLASVFSFNSSTQVYNAVTGAGGTMASTSLSNTTGYAAYDYNDGPVTASYVGTIGKGPIGVPISNVNDNLNLVPNPYPSPIDWDNVTRTGLQSVMYLRAGNNIFSSYVAGGLATLPPFGGWAGEISTGQAFWTVSDGSASTLNFKETDKISTSNKFVRKASPQDFVRIQLRSANQMDETIIHFVDGATDGNDSQGDAKKFRNGNYVSALGQNNYVNISSYNTSTTKDFAINSIGKIEAGGSKTVYLKIFDVQPGPHSLKFTDISTLSLGYKITLIDHFLDKKVDVVDNMTYSFTVGPNSLSFGDSRFELRFQGVDIITAIGDLTSDETRAYPNPVVNKLYVKLSDQDEANLKSIVLIDVLGNVIVNSDKSKYLLEPGIKTIEMSEYSSGFYILNVQSGDIIKSIRVIKK